MSYKNRKYMYDLLVSTGKLDKIVDRLKVEFGIPEEPTPVDNTPVDMPKKKAVKTETA